MFIATLFIIVEKWKYPKCPSSDEYGVNVFGGGGGGMNEQHVKWVGKAVIFV